MAAALPTDRRWYRELLVEAAVLAVAIGVLGLIYLGLTGILSAAIFGEPRVQPLSGEWWWIPFAAAGGVLIVALRGWWRAPERIPGGVAVIQSGAVDHRVAPSWVGLAFVSAVAGASLGPSFALVMMGGGLPRG
jgi:hypothetical protein